MGKVRWGINLGLVRVSLLLPAPRVLLTCGLGGAWGAFHCGFAPCSSCHPSLSPSLPPFNRTLILFAFTSRSFQVHDCCEPFESLASLPRHHALHLFLWLICVPCSAPLLVQAFLGFRPCPLSLTEAHHGGTCAWRVEGQDTGNVSGFK